MNPVKPTDSLAAPQPQLAPDSLLPLPAGLPLTDVPACLVSDPFTHGVLHGELNPLSAHIDSLCGTHTEIQPPPLRGMEGQPVPYSLKHDDFVTLCLMLAFFLVVLVVSRSRHFLKLRFKNFFQRRLRDNLFAERAETRLRGRLFLVVQTAFVVAVLLFRYVSQTRPQLFAEVSPYLLLGTATLVLTLYYLLKLGLYRFVNSIFFDATRSNRFTQAYLLCILALGVFLLPVALLVVYLELSFDSFVWVSVCALIVDKILLFYKQWSIFFGGPAGPLHLFLYFCTLELVPLVLLCQMLGLAGGYLLTIR